MPGSLSEQMISKIKDAEGLYHRLLLVVAPCGGGKTTALQALAKDTGFRYINVNLELSRRLLDLTERQRCLQVTSLLKQIVGEEGDGVVLLDNLEILFDVSLKQDPLRCIQGLSRNRTVVAAWCGSIKDGDLTYAAPDHREYRRYPAQDLLIVSP